MATDLGEEGVKLLQPTHRCSHPRPERIHLHKEGNRSRKHSAVRQRNNDVYRESMETESRFTYPCEVDAALVLDPVATRAFAAPTSAPLAGVSPAVAAPTLCGRRPPS